MLNFVTRIFFHSVNNFVIFEHEISILLYINKSFLLTIEHFSLFNVKKKLFSFFFFKKKVTANFAIVRFGEEFFFGSVQPI